MELGAVFPQKEIGNDPAVIKAFAQAVEEMGFTHLLLYDHVLGADPDRPGGWRGGYDKDDAFHEPFVTMGYLAAVTEKLTLTTTVLILPQRQTALVAKQAAEVDVLSGGRLRLGVGTGWNQIEYEALNEDFSTRGQRQAEQVELMRKLWTEDSLTYQGKWHTVTKASINPRPARPIPIWFGGNAPALLKRTAALGDGWMPLMGPNDKAKAALDTIYEQMQANGRDTANFGIQAQAQARGGDPDRWQSHAAKWRGLGATHLAIATMDADFKTVDEHLDAMRRYYEAVNG
ncbi:MAG: LLM class F420-dependent oxidoreductase [Pseudomonadota bacterium]